MKSSGGKKNVMTIHIFDNNFHNMSFRNVLFLTDNLSFHYYFQERFVMVPLNN